MAWRSRQKRDSSLGEEAAPIEVFASGSGVIVEGSPSAVADFVDQMLEVTGEARGRSRHIAIDGFQIFANVMAIEQTHREYIEFSPRAIGLLKQYGSIPTSDGYFRSFVRHGQHFAGNLDWKSVNLGPEQALGLQAVAGQMALRAAIKEITVALERIEGKVDQIAALMEAERIGSVVADRATLQPLVDRVRTAGKFSETDWATVASLGPVIAQDVETLRTFVLRQLKDVKESSLVRTRAGEAEELTDRLLKESLALLVVAEDNFAMWQELRLTQTVLREPAATDDVAAGIRSQLDGLAQRDQQLADLLREVTDRLTARTGYEGLAPIQKQRLLKHVGQLDEMNRWFCDERNLDGHSIERPELARMSDSLRKVGEVIGDGARTASKTISQVSERLRARTETDRDEDPPEAIKP